jgi:hypothetical protein
MLHLDRKVYDVTRELTFKSKIRILSTKAGFSVPNFCTPLKRETICSTRFSPIVDRSPREQANIHVAQNCIGGGGPENSRDISPRSYEIPDQRNNYTEWATMTFHSPHKTPKWYQYCLELKQFCWERASDLLSFGNQM